MTSEGPNSKKDPIYSEKFDLLEVGDLVQLKYLSFKDENFEQLVNYVNSNTLGIVLETFYSKKEPYHDFWSVPIMVLIDGAKYKTPAKNWIKK